MIPNPRAPASFEEARAAVLAAAPRLEPPDVVPIAEAGGRVLAEDVASVADVPGFDNSGMDGYAVRTEDVAGASAEAPRRLRVVGDLPAGRAPEGLRVGPGEAIRIMTGAPVPDGADQVVELERTAPTPDGAGPGSIVTVLAAREPGANIRRAGEDLRRGARALGAGARLGAPEIGLLAACGREVVKVGRRPLVAILSTGDEVVPPGTPEPLARGRVRDANLHSLAAAAVACGARPLALGIARDEPGTIAAAVRAGLERGANALVTTAGISVGARDCAPDVFRELGFAERFREVKIKPGRPFTFYVAGTCPIFALPGNPVAALVCFDLFVRPALLAMQGARALDRPEVVAVSDRALKARPGRVNFVRARLRYDAETPGGYRVAEVLPEGSGISRTMHHADALLRVDAPVAPGGRVRAILLRAQEMEPEVTP